jgi:hypothetical protein
VGPALGGVRSIGWDTSYTPTVTVGHARPGIQHGLRLIAAVERNSLAGLVASLTGGKLRYAVAERQ